MLLVYYIGGKKMNYSNRINAIKSYFTELSKRVSDNIQKYSSISKVGVGALAAIVAAEYAKPANAEELYLVNRSDKPVIAQKDTESAENFYDKNTAVITTSKTQTQPKKKLQRLIADLSLGLEAGDSFSQASTGAKLIITPDFDKNAWRAIVEGTARAGTKQYPSGDSLNFGDFRTGVRVGRYADIRKFIEGTKVYAEIGAMLEGTEYQNRTEMSNYRAMAEAAIGFFSSKTGTNAKITLAVGKGEYNLLTNGTKQTDDLTRMLADLQIKQEIPGMQGPYGKARISFTDTNYNNRADAIVIAVEAGAGIQTKIKGLDAFVEALFTYRQEKNEYFNGANTAKDVFGARLIAGMMLTKELMVKLGMEYDEELLFRAIAELALRL